MCGVKGQANIKFPESTTIPSPYKETLIKREVKEGLLFTGNFNIWTGMSGWVLTADEPHHLQPMTFGFTPSWSQKKLYLFNARAEGKANESNDTSYSGRAGIFEMPSFRSAITKRRCVVPVDYFIEGTITGKLQEPYMIRRSDCQPFLLAGIWEEWVEKSTGEVIRSYSVITTAAAPLLAGLPHHRSPLVLREDAVGSWLSSASARETLEGVMKPFDSTGFEAIRISPEVKKKQNDPRLFSV